MTYTIAHSPLRGADIQNLRFSDCQALFDGLTLLHELAAGFVSQPRVRCATDQNPFDLTPAGEYLDDLQNWLGLERDRIVEEVRRRVDANARTDANHMAMLLQYDLMTETDPMGFVARAAALASKVQKAAA